MKKPMATNNDLKLRKKRGRYCVLPESFLRMPHLVARARRATPAPSLIAQLHKRQLCDPRDAEAALTTCLLAEFRWRWWHTNTLSSPSTLHDVNQSKIVAGVSSSLLAIRVIRTTDHSNMPWSTPTCRLWVHDLRSDAQWEVTRTVDQIRDFSRQLQQH